MSFTINKLAKLSGVSTRTLRFYDEIGLLKPAFYGNNQYRYYEQEQLLTLQQILFYRELGFSLDEIKKVVNSDEFDKIHALEAHKTTLKKRLEYTAELIKTIDKTLAHLKGEKVMKIEEIFVGFNAEKQKLYEDFLVANGVDNEVISHSKGKLQTWSKEEALRHKQQTDLVHERLVDAINKKLSPTAPEVQALIEKHYQLIKVFWTPTKETYIGLTQLYASHPDFVKFYGDIHPELLDFLSNAMKVYANNNLI